MGARSSWNRDVAFAAGGLEAVQVVLQAGDEGHVTRPAGAVPRRRTARAVSAAAGLSTFKNSSSISRVAWSRPLIGSAGVGQEARQGRWSPSAHGQGRKELDEGPVQLRRGCPAPRCCSRPLRGRGPGCRGCPAGNTGWPRSAGPGSRCAGPAGFPRAPPGAPSACRAGSRLIRSASLRIS